VLLDECRSFGRVTAAVEIGGHTARRIKRAVKRLNPSSVPGNVMSIPKVHKRRKSASAVLAFTALALGGCSAGAPSFVLFGAFFPAWLLCGTLGIIGAGMARAVFVASGLSGVLPYQLFVCSAVGVIVALLVWLIGLGQ
jgi:YtcA-like protein